MACLFQTIEACRVLDRIRIPVPRGDFTWRLHVVHAAGPDSNRVFGYAGAADTVIGCFARYPDRLLTTALDTAEYCGDAWPWFRRTPGPFTWRAQPVAFARLIERYHIRTLEDIPALPWSTVCWYARLDIGGDVLRRYAWFDADGVNSVGWGLLQAHSDRLAGLRESC